ncbi:MAG: sigma-70 family RNA polymerase sigma factor [Clostridia bacterium]|nr:sigma-70 family RNA polymerase sigma factor [Clostridia bacterium]
MTQEEIAGYAGKVFGFCLKRLGNVEDARDLSQEILCEAIASIQTTKPEHPEAWLWTIAHNRYCRHIRNRKQALLLMQDSLLDTFFIENQYDFSNEKQAIFDALHTLASSHRDILIDFYVNGMSCDEIAKKHNLPPKTVRTRLFYGRKKLRERWQIKMDENHIYQKQQWLMVRNGDVDPGILDRQIVRGIISSCYEQFQSVEDISLATGIPSMYIEDEIPRLLFTELLEQKGEKYRAKLVIHRASFATEAEAILLKLSHKLANRIVRTLQEITPTIRTIGFYGSTFPDCQLWWCVAPRLIRHICLSGCKKTPELTYTYRPLHKDGTRGWLCVYEDQSNQNTHYDFLRQKGFRYYWSHELYSSLTLHSLLVRLEELQISGPQLSITDKLLLTDCIRCGLVVRGKDGPRWNIPIFTSSQMKDFNFILSQAADPLIPDILPTITVLYERMKMEIPSHLHEQISGIFPIELLSIIQMICQHMLHKGYLQKPLTGHLSGRAIMVLGDTTRFIL